MNKRALTVPVDTDAAKPCCLSENPQRHRVHATVLRPPVCGKAIEVTAGFAAFDRFATVVADTAITGSDFDFLSQLIPDGLEFACQLSIDHLRAAAAGTLELVSFKILRELCVVIAAKRNNRHSELSPFTQNRAFPVVRHRPG